MYVLNIYGILIRNSQAAFTYRALLADVLVITFSVVLTQPETLDGRPRNLSISSG